MILIFKRWGHHINRDLLVEKMGSLRGGDYCTIFFCCLLFPPLVVMIKLFLKYVVCTGK